MNLRSILLLFLLQILLRFVLMAAFGVLVIPKVQQVPGMSSHRRDVPSDDFVQIFELLISDP